MPTPYQRIAYEYARDRVGKTSRTTVRANPDETVKLPVNVVNDSPEPRLTSYYTIGLGEYESRLTSGSGRPLRFEFLLAARSDQPLAIDGISNAALNLASGDYSAKPGYVYPSILEGYDQDTTAIHGLLWYPLSWAGSFDGATIEGLDVEWLQILPITADEFAWVTRKGPGFQGPGTEALIDAFEAQRPDLYDLSRPSVALPE